MLETTLLKVKHWGEDEAKKLLPYIQQADVFSPEIAFATEQWAVYQEKDWIKALQMSRSKFLEIGKRRYDGQVEPKLVEYNLKREDYLFRAKIPIFFLEKWNQREVVELEAKNNEETRLFSQATTYLRTGKVTEYLEIAPRAISLSIQNVKKRDKKMVETLSDAERIIREQYVQLKIKDPIQLVMELGAAHYPESWADLPIRVIELDNPHQLGRELSEKFYKIDSESDYSPKDVLVFGLVMAMSLPISFDEEELRSLNFEELKRKVERGLYRGR